MMPFTCEAHYLTNTLFWTCWAIIHYYWWVVALIRVLTPMFYDACISCEAYLIYDAVYL